MSGSEKLLAKISDLDEQRAKIIKELRIHSYALLCQMFHSSPTVEGYVFFKRPDVDDEYAMTYLIDGVWHTINTSFQFLSEERRKEAEEAEEYWASALHELQGEGFHVTLMRGITLEEYLDLLK